MRWLDGITDRVDVTLSRLWETVKAREASHAAVLWSCRVGHNLATEQQQHENNRFERPAQFSWEPWFQGLFI